MSLIVLLTSISVKADPPTLSAALNKVTRSYLGLKNALVNNNGMLAANKALAMIAALNEVPDLSMTADQHRVWLQYLNKMEVNNRSISQTGALERQRKAFAALSDDLYAVLKTFNINQVKLYRQYSADEDYYWLSEKSAIKNPYHGIGNAVGKGETRDILNVKR